MLELELNHPDVHVHRAIETRTEHSALGIGSRIRGLGSAQVQTKSFKPDHDVFSLP